jgi:hypothetical protein
MEHGEDLPCHAKRRAFFQKFLQDPLPSGRDINRQMEKLNRAIGFAGRMIRQKTGPPQEETSFWPDGTDRRCQANL